MTRILLIAAIALTAQTATPSFAGNAGNANIIAPNNYTPIPGGGYTPIPKLRIKRATVGQFNGMTRRK